MNHHPLFNKYRKEHVETHRLDKELIYRLLGYLKPYRWWVVLAVLILIIAKGIEAVVPIYIGYTTQAIINKVGAAPEVKQELLNIIFRNCFDIIILLIVGYALDTANIVLKSWISQKALYTLRSEVYQHIEHLPLAYFDSHPVGRLMTRTIHDVDQINQMFSESVIPILGSIVLFISMFIGITILDWRVAIVFGCIVPVVYWLTNRFRIYQRHCYDIVRNIVTAMNTFAQEQLLGASTVRNFGLQKAERKRFEELNEDHREANIETIHHFSFFIAGIDFLQSLSLILVFVTLVIFTTDSQFQVGTFFTFSLYALMFFRPLIDLAERYNVLQSAMSASERIFHVMDESTEFSQKPREEAEEVSIIVFEDVWFAYEKEDWVLKGISFEIKKGESIAIVGMTGVGKTTILNLLLRFYDFQKGSIKINGQDIREYPLQNLRKFFSIVLQDPVIFSGTIRDNISLYQPHITPEYIEAVAKYLNLGPLLDRFPKGLNHHLSERGQNLSTGEMQLIALARAVVQGRSVLVLDEATANIDTHTEKMIQDALQKVLTNHTAFVIAHRLSTIRDTSRIIVLNNGIVAESGTHKQLLKQKGLYEKLYRLQFREPE